MFAALVPAADVKDIVDHEDEHEPAHKPSEQRVHLVCMMVAAGCLSGVVALSYDWAMEALLWLTWEKVPALLTGAGLFDGVLAGWAWVYTLAAAMIMCGAAGAAISVLGFPGKHSSETV
jgi:uncharacterized membrane protein